MSKIISDPSAWKPAILVNMIENSSDSFTDGRRNNDLVNWFIARRLQGIQAGETELQSATYRTAFLSLIRHGMTERQEMSIDRWDENVMDKITRLCEYYMRHDTNQLYDLWLPMDYEIDQVHEGQTTLL